MKLTIFDLDHDFERKLLSSNENMEPMLKEVGAQLLPEAQSRARKRTNNLADGIHWDIGADDDGDIIGRLNATDFKSHWWEFGHDGRPPDAYLRGSTEDVVGPVTGGDK